MSKQQVLIVEDERSLRHALRDEFVRAGFSVLETSNGEEGINTALTAHPDIILLDIIMPVMDGMAMLRRLREDTWGKTVPVIILTNLAADARFAEAVAAGTYDYFVKVNWTIEQVVQRVRDRLAGQLQG
jgi:DNA-binding response OmpR family regulator